MLLIIIQLENFLKEKEQNLLLFGIVYSLISITFFVLLLFLLNNNLVLFLVKIKYFFLILQRTIGYLFIN